MLDLDFTKGYAKDHSGNGNNGSFGNTAGSGSIAGTYTNGPGGYGFKTVSSTDTITVPHDESLNVTNGTFYFYADANFSGENKWMIAKRTGGATNYDIGINPANNIQLYDGTTTGQLNLGAMVQRATVFAISIESGQAGKVYVDGVYKGDLSAANTLNTSSTPDLLIGQYYLSSAPRPWDSNIYSVLIYATNHSASEVDQTTKALKQRKTPFKQKENFTTAPSVGAVESGMAENAVLIGGETIDQGPNGYNGTLVSDVAGIQPAGMTASTTPWGEPCLLNRKGTEAHLNYGTASNTAFATSESVFGYARWFKCSSNGAQMLMSRSGNYFFQKVSSGNLQLSMGSGAWSITNSPIRNDVWHLMSFFLDGDNEYIYVDGEQMGKRARTGKPFTGTLREGQYVIPGFDIDGGIGPRIFYKEFTDLAEYERELKAEWNRVANKVIYHQDFSDAYEHVSTYAPGPLPGTDWTVSSVSGQVKVDDDGSKYVTSPSAGNVFKRPGTDHTFGRLEYVVTPTSGTRTRHSFSGSGTFAILDVGDGGNERIAYTTSTGGVVFATANSSATTDKQTIRIDKKANLNTNNTTLYKDDVLLTAATGSNPCTDTTNFTAERQLTSYSNAKIHSITHYFGVPLD